MPNVGDIQIVDHDRQGYWQGDYTLLPYLGRDWFCDRIRGLWYCGYYDGPLSGVCLYEGEKRWFTCAEEIFYNEWTAADEDYPEMWEPCMSRRFVVFGMTPEDTAYEVTRHEKFQAHVGWHCDFEPDGRRAGGCWDQKEWSKFDEWSKTNPRQHGEMKPLAWFGFAIQEGEHAPA